MLPEAQILILIAWVVVGLVLVGIGQLFRRAFHAPAEGAEGLLLSFWLGWACLLVGLQVWQLLLPIGVAARLACVVAGVAGLVLGGARPWIQMVRGAPRAWLAILLFLAAALWLSNHALGGARFGDTGAYYVPTVRWLLAYPIVPGVGNLHAHYALNQSYFLYVAALEEGPFAGRSFHLANSLLVLALCARIALALSSVARFRRAASALDLFYVFLLPGVLPLGLSMFLTSPMPDLAVFALGAVVSAELTALLADDEREHGRKHDFCLRALALLVAAGVTVKLSFVGLGLGLMPVAWIAWVWRERPDRSRLLRAIGAVVLLGMLAIVPWIGRNIVMSGLPFFPRATLALPVEWRVSADVEGWLRNTVYTGGWQVIVNDPRWYLGRLEFWGWNAPDVLVPLAIGLLALVVAIVRRVVEWRDPLEPHVSLALVLPGLASLIYCLILSPVPRYAGATIWVIAASGLLLAIGDRALRPSTSQRPVLLALIVAATAASLATATDPWWLQLNDFEPMSPVRWDEKRLETGLVVNVPQKTEACWDAPLPCTPFPNPALRLRREQDLGAGFMLDPELNARFHYDPGAPSVR